MTTTPHDTGRRSGGAHTLEPWQYDAVERWGERIADRILAPDGFVVVADVAEERDARLIAAAPDHALIGWAMCVAAGRWRPWGDGLGEFCINGFCHTTKLDEFGVPEMTANLRAAILKAKGADHAE